MQSFESDARQLLDLRTGYALVTNAFPLIYKSQDIEVWILISSATLRMYNFNIPFTYNALNFKVINIESAQNTIRDEKVIARAQIVNANFDQWSRISWSIILKTINILPHAELSLLRLLSPGINLFIPTAAIIALRSSIWNTQD